MNIDCDREPLQKACAMASAIIPSGKVSSSKPQLRCVRMETVEGGLVLSATDFERTLSIRLPGVTIREPGLALVPAEHLLAIVRESSDETVQISTDNAKATIRLSDGQFRLVAPSSDLLPAPAILEPEKATFTVDAGAMEAMIDATSFAAAKELTRYALNGVLLEIRGDKLVMVATDGKRLSKTSADIVRGQGTTGTIRAIVPVSSLHLLQKLCSDSSDVVKVFLGGNGVGFLVGKNSLMAPEVSGIFPDYENVIPKPSDNVAILDIPAMLSACRLAALMSSKDVSRVLFTFDTGQVTLQADQADTGESHVTVRNTHKAPNPYHYTGKRLAVELNPHFVMEGLKVMGKADDTVRLEMSTHDRPACMTSNEHTYVIMPLSSRKAEEAVKEEEKE